MDLAQSGSLPGALGDMATVIRKVGNIASHADGEDVDRWDAELVDALFRSLVDGLYVAPAKVARMRERIASRDASRSSEPPPVGRNG